MKHPDLHVEVYEEPPGLGCLRGLMIFQFSPVGGDSGFLFLEGKIAIRRWCWDQFGPDGKGRWQGFQSSIVFEDPVMATAFKLRWC